jgi:hypothetical protein
MNKGEKIYFPGFYYGALQWGKMIGVKTNKGYGDHRRYQREFACQRQKVIDDNELDGYYVHKIKKCGITQLIALFHAIEAVTNRQFTIASMSKNHDTAKAANFKYLTYCLKNLPPVLMPSVEQTGWASAVQKIEIRTNDPALSLENVVVAVPSTTDGLDGLPPIKRITLSEMPKMAEAEAIFTKSKEQARIQKTKIGIIEMESYPPEDDTKSFKYCKNLYNLDCMALDEKGYPKNKIVPLYIGLLEATMGTHDIYGEPDRRKALEMELKERDKCDTPAKKQDRKRQYHMTAKEGWEVGGGGSVYNNLILTEQQTILEEAYKLGDLNYRQGNLEWTAGFGSRVRFVPLTLQEIMDGKVGRWRVYASDEYIERNTNKCFDMPRKVKTIDGEKKLLLQPPDDIIHVAGTDPVDYARVSEVGKKRSTNASIIRGIDGTMKSVYYFRDEDPDMALEDFCMEMIFWGLRSIVEGNRKNAVTTLENLGMYYFILVRHPNGEIVPYGNKMKIKHVNSGKDLTSKYVSLVVKHIKHNIEYFQDVRVIEDHKEFDPTDTQDYDLAVADGLSFVALDAMQTWVLSKKSHHNKYEEMGAAIARLG